MSNYSIDGQIIYFIDERFSDDGERLIRFFLADGSIRFYVVKDIPMYRVWHLTTVYGGSRTHEAPVKDTEEYSFADAMVWAEMLATDHAKRIDAPVVAAVIGYSFMTNNKTLVEYRVRIY